MKKILFAALLMGMTFFSPVTVEAKPMLQVYREVQSILYTCYGGDPTGWAAANWYLQSSYGMTLQDFFWLWDVQGYTGPVELSWTMY